jgi:hypothetical protein
MKNFVAAGVVAMLMAGFYALGSTPARHTANYNSASVCSSKFVTDTVPKKKDTMNRRDTLQRRDSLQ